MIIKSAKYKTSVVSVKDMLNDGIPEFVFVGRSNVGKSSLINYLTGVKGLALTSATPGKTKMINYFDINDKFRFVDLPGYGYANVSKENLLLWSEILSNYLLTSFSLQTVFVLLDIRITPTKQDKQMVEFLVQNNIPFLIICTKIDKLPKSKIPQQVQKITYELGLRKDMFKLSSSEKNIGKESILDYIENRLEYDKNS